MKKIVEGGEKGEREKEKKKSGGGAKTVSTNQ